MALAIGKTKLARSHFEQALARDPWNRQAHQGLATLDEIEIADQDRAATQRPCGGTQVDTPGAPENDDCLSTNRR